MDMNPSNNLPNFQGTHFVDIHEVLHEDEEEGEGEKKLINNNNNTNVNVPNHHDKAKNRFVHPKIRNINTDGKRPPPHHKGFSRQVSLETGFSVLNGGSSSNNKAQKKLLTRSGNSFGDYGSARCQVAEGRKADFNMFRTKSTLSRQNSALPPKDVGGNDPCLKKDIESGGVDVSVPAGRYFAALKGPELDQVKDSEDILLPKDELWPFLLRFPIGCFGICLGLSSQSILWHALAVSKSTQFLHITPFINIALWILALSILVAVTVTYALKCALYFEAVKREYFHPVRVNFFFAPWVVCMFLSIGVPPKFAPETLHPAIWCVFITPILFLDLKIYGQWLSGGKRRLSKVANPSSHLSVVGNFVGAILAAKVGWVEPGKFLWAVGFAHYLVVFVTLYQRLPTSEALPKELHPVYSMFIATPAAASIAWGAIYGQFDGLARTCYFMAVFLYLSLVVRINFFWGFRFSVAWWSYTFPMTTVSIAAIKYADEVPCPFSKGFAVALSFMSSTMVSILFVSTLLHAFYWQTLFPNDLAIAITTKRTPSANKDKKSPKKRYDLKKWTKQSPLSFVSNLRKQHSGDKCSDEEN
ncbi:OLC1v1029449C1 [Oldenlandia corymbosa var. corymbosa]|uniref:OLC1v1029449C1 n=1 Tax=Oldenlandia corymbosa var. corymbosa TaxID=529605 RepID=A0AAV1CDX2_OLDCO|nr:OLC1v1029449C1 [Oldenlandia corymbosa var. corymbosa]